MCISHKNCLTSRGGGHRPKSEFAPDMAGPEFAVPGYDLMIGWDKVEGLGAGAGEDGSAKGGAEEVGTTTGAGTG